MKQLEPMTPWSNAMEGVTHEPKKATGRDMARSRAPKHLWDDCLEHQAYVHSLTALDIYDLKGQVPETMVSGETADISPWAIYKWYEWVKFRDTSVGFPETPKL